MDSLLLCTADQTPPAPTDSQTGGLDSSAPLRSPAENMLSAYETGAATMSDVSDQFDKSTETLSNVPKCLSQEKTTDSNCVKPLSPGCNMAECLSLCSEPAPESDDSRACGCFSSSDPVLRLLPDLSHDLISESFSECYVKQEPALYFPLTQENSTPGGARSSASEGLMEPYVTEPLSSFSSEQHQASHLLRSLSNQSDSLGSDSAIAPESDLYIFESETQDFTLSPNLDPQEIKCLEYQPLTQTGVIKGDRNCETHVLMCDSENVVTQCHHGSGEEQTMMDYESDVSQYTRTGPRAPAVDAYEAGMVSVNDARQGRVTDLTSQSRRSDSPIELWLDACQYLTGEDAEDRDVWDKTGHSVTPGGLMATTDLASPPGEIQVSGYSPDGTEGIGWPSDDTRGWGPSVERWSSVDSWASALSDWTGIITSPPEDFTAAFTEIGAEIDALTQALAEVNTPVDTATSTEGKSQEPAVQSQLPMGVQDQPLEAQNTPESPLISGQSCLSLCLEAGGTELQDKEGSQNAETRCDSTPSTQGQSQEPAVQSQLPMGVQDQPLEASMGSYGATGGCGVDVIPGSASSADLDLCHSNPYVGSFEPNILISSEEDPIILNIIEDTDLEGQNAPVELIIEEPFGDGVCEVTDECSFSPPGSGAEQEAKRSSESAEVDREETKSSTNVHFLSHTVTNSHVQGVDSQTGLHNNLDTHVPADTLPDLDGACQLEPRWGSPKFIMPLAPLGIGSSLVRRASSLEGDQIYAKRSLTDNRHLCSDLGEPRILLSNSDGITDKQSLEDDEKLIHKKETTKASSENSSPEGQHNTITQRKTLIEEITDLSRELSNLAVVSADQFIISKENRVAFITLDVNDLFTSRAAKPIATAVKSEKAEVKEKTVEKMPHKTHKATSESKPRSKKDKSASHHYGTPAPKKQETVSHHVSAQQVGKQQETHPLTEETHSSENGTAALEEKEANLVIESSVATEKTPSKPHGKKKKKHAQNTTGGKSVGEPLVEVDNGAKAKTAKGRIDMFEAKLGAKAGKSQKDSDQPRSAEKKSQQTEAKASQAEQPPHRTDDKAQQPKNVTNPLKDDIIKRRRLSQDKFGKLVGALESKLPKPDFPVKANGGEPKTDAGAARKKAYSEVVKQKIPPKEDPKVVQPIQPMSDSGDPQSLCLWCQFAAVSSDYTVTWSRDSIVLSEIKRSAGDESRVLLTISNASHKDLGKYQCRLTSLHGSVTLDYLLKYEVLSEIVIPPSPKTSSSAPVEVVSEEEDVNCSRLLFKEDFLSHQYFGENQSASIITEKVHFGEGMHRRAFRTKMQAGQIPLLLPGHSCVLKVHNAISYGTKNNEELIHRNFTLAVEECQVQNTAREYIKAYTSAAQSFEGFGETPDIIPIYLVHRPSNDIPYATLEEELIGDFVKYSVRDGKEINLMRRDSEAGQKCCAFQHWVYQKTEGNLLVTDMQGVGMKLTDVGIATCKKGYNGFKGNCATSFIDQFKALHQCNKYCEILDLKSLQPKPKKPASAPKPRPQTSLPAPKKKLFGPTVKGKS